MAELTAFGREVKHRLIDMGKSQEWLIAQLRARTGLYMDSSYLYKILIGKEHGTSFVPLIRRLLEMNDAETEEE